MERPKVCGKGLEGVKEIIRRKGICGPYLDALQEEWDVWTAHHDGCSTSYSLRGPGQKGSLMGVGGTVTFCGYDGDIHQSRTYEIGCASGEFCIKSHHGAGLKR
jgi:hypothetical protein